MSEPIVGTKRCSKCGGDKPVGEFWRDLNAKDGRFSWCRSCASAHARRQYAELKDAVLGHYGTACACCASTRHLAIDHVNGDGREHRQSLSTPGNVGYSIGDLNSTSMYKWLVENGFPDGFQVLCRPCNSSKRRGEHCRIDHTRPRPRKYEEAAA